MLTQIPLYVNLLFILVVMISILWLYQASKSKVLLFVCIIWTIIQSGIGLSGIYQKTELIPPLIMPLGILPPLLILLLCLTTKKGKIFLSTFNLKSLTYFHSIRIAVEILLASLFQIGVMSIYISYHGTNFDLISGVTAPVVAYIAFKSMPLNRKLLAWWNIAAVLLLLNVVITATLAIPSPFQKLAFEQPNIAILYFPFNLLPTVVVPLVLFAHAAALYQLNVKRH